jgi:hypothetical protein
LLWVVYDYNPLALGVALRRLRLQIGRFVVVLKYVLREANGFRLGLLDLIDGLILFQIRLTVTGNEPE